MQHDNILSSERLCRECAAPRTINPEPVLLEAVCLYDEGISFSALVVRRQVEPAGHFMPIGGLPSDVLNPSELQV